MKKTSKVALMVAVILVLSGLIIGAFFSFLTVREKLSIYDVLETKYSTKYERHEKVFPASGVNTIFVNELNNNIRIESSEGRDSDNITVSYCNSTNEKEPYTFALDQKEGQLLIEHISLPRMEIGFGSMDRTLVITLPAEYAGAVSITTENGDMDISGIAFDRGMQLKTSNGKVNVHDISADFVDISSSNGEIKLEEVSAGSIFTNTGNGETGITETLAEMVLTVESRNGNIKLDDVTGGHVTLTTRNGNVTGTLEGKPSDYSVLVHCSSGSSNLVTRLEGDKMLDITTRNGSVKVDFTED